MPSLKAQINLTIDQKQKLNNNHCLVFTDLDGTLLGHDGYDLGVAPDVMRTLEGLGWPIIFNTSKTWPEARVLQQKLHYFNPCVVENGGGIHYLDASQWQPKIKAPATVSRENINVILDQIQGCFQFERMRDWSEDHIIQQTGLPQGVAALANKRLYSEPLLWQDTEARLVDFGTKVEAAGLKLVRGGRFCHLMGSQDKSTAMLGLVDAYENDFGIKPFVIALGDNHNDKMMLEKADLACVLTLPNKEPLVLKSQLNRIYPFHVAPQGWCDAVQYILSLQR